MIKNLKIIFNFYFGSCYRTRRKREIIHVILYQHRYRTRSLIMAKKKYYVVWVGRKPGVYTSWSECEAQVKQFDNAKFKSFSTKHAAEKAYKDGWKEHWGQAGIKTKKTAP